MKQTDVGSLGLVQKRDHWPFDDHTSTMMMKKEAMTRGVDAGPINYRPQHERTARGILFGVALGTGVLLLLGGIAIMVYRMVT
jgi:hypothetical protein